MKPSFLSSSLLHCIYPPKHPHPSIGLPIHQSTPINQRISPIPQRMSPVFMTPLMKARRNIHQKEDMINTGWTLTMSIINKVINSVLHLVLHCNYDLFMSWFAIPFAHEIHTLNMYTSHSSLLSWEVLSSGLSSGIELIRSLMQTCKILTSYRRLGSSSTWLLLC